MAKNNVRINDLKYVFKSNVVIFSLALFSNFLLISGATMAAYYGLLGYSEKESLKNILFSFAGSNQWVTVALIVASAVFPMAFAWKMFGFVNKKKASSVYLSFGVSRKELFFNRVIAGAFIFALVIVIPFAIGIIWNIAVFGSSSVLFQSALFVVLRLLISWLINFAITVFVIVSVGTKLEEFVFSTIFIFILTVLKYFLSAMQKLFFYGFGYKYSSVITSDYMFLNEAGRGTAIGSIERFNSFPITDFDVLFKYMSGDKGAGRASIDLTALFAMILIFIFVLFFAYKKFINRKSEVTGFFGVSIVSNVVFTGTVAMFVAIVFGNIFAKRISSGSADSLSTTAIILLLAVALVAIYLIIMPVLMHNKKAFIKTIWRAPIFAVVLMFPAIVMMTGGFGASQKIPEVSEIKGASISLPIDASIMVLGHTNRVSQFVSITGSTDFSFTGFTSQNDIEQIRKIHKKLIDLKDKSTSRTRPYMDKILIAYELNDGSIIQRIYDYFDKDVANEWLKIVDSDFLKSKYIDAYNNTQPLDDKEAKELAKSYPIDSGFLLLNDSINSKLNGKTLRIYGAERTTTDINMDEIQIVEFRKAVAKDLENVSLSTIYFLNKKELGTIRFCQENFIGDADIIEMPIVKEMKNTLEYLEKFDFLTKYGKSVRPLYATVFDLKNFLSNNLAYSTMNASYYLNDVKESFTSEEYTDFLKALERCQCAYFETESENDVARLREVSLSNQFTYNEGYVVVYRYADYTQRSEYIPYDKIPNDLRPN